MKATISATISAVLLAAGQCLGAATTNRPAGIVNPDWVKRPTPEEITSAWPTRALEHGVKGRAEISCRVNIQGLAEACSLISEFPKDFGFGDAALSLAPQFQFRPATRDGEPIASQVNVPVAFETPERPSGSSDFLSEFILLQRSIWAQAPLFADVAGAYPRGGRGEAGYVVFRCGVKADGALRNCEKVRENPSGQGFEPAARGLLKLFRIDMSRYALRPGQTIMTDVPIRLIAPTSAEFTNREIGQPFWLTVVDPEKAASFPTQAAKAGLQTGRGVADCVVDPDGSLKTCSAGLANPPNMGFSELAVEVAKIMRMNRWSGAGGPIDGAPLHLPVRFNLRADQPSR